jgi:hypothetical protein
MALLGAAQQRERRTFAPARLEQAGPRQHDGNLADVLRTGAAQRPCRVPGAPGRDRRLEAPQQDGRIVGGERASVLEHRPWVESPRRPAAAVATQQPAELMWQEPGAEPGADAADPQQAALGIGPRAPFLGVHAELSMIVQ